MARECLAAHESFPARWICVRFFPPGWEARLYGRHGCPPLQFKLDKFFGSAWLGAMKIPEFKPSKHFLGVTDLPCLVAKVKNSKLPGKIATKYRRDPVCEIYLRGKNPNVISTWQKKILDQFFANAGLASAIEQATRTWSRESYAWSDMSKSDRMFAAKHGFAPFLTVSMIVIDAIKREAIIHAHTTFDGHLEEHGGVSIYLKKGRWCFEDAEYFDSYCSPFGTDYADRKEQEQLDNRRQKWNSLFPPPSPKTPVTSDCSFLYGRWELNDRESSLLRKSIKDSSVPGLDMIGTHMVISETKLQTALGVGNGRIRGIERRGDWIRIDVDHEFPQLTEDAPSWEFWFDGDRLVRKGGYVYRKQDPWADLFPMPKLGTRSENDPSFLDGYWEFDPRKTTQVLLQLGKRNGEIGEEVETQKEISPTGYRFTPGTRLLISCGEVADEDDLLGCQRTGNRVTLRHRMKDGELVVTDEWWCDGEYLVDRSGIAYRREADKWAELFPATESGEVDSTFSSLLGDWKLDLKKTKEVLGQLGKQQKQIASDIKEAKMSEPSTLRFWSKADEMFTSLQVGSVGRGDRPWEWERNGSRFIIRQRARGVVTDTIEYWCNGEFLVKRSGIAYQRVGDSHSKAKG